MASRSRRTRTRNSGHRALREPAAVEQLALAAAPGGSIGISSPASSAVATHAVSASNRAVLAVFDAAEFDQLRRAVRLLKLPALCESNGAPGFAKERDRLRLFQGNEFGLVRSLVDRDRASRIDAEKADVDPRHLHPNEHPGLQRE